MTSRMQQGERSDYTFMAQLGTMMKLARPFVFSIKPGSCADEADLLEGFKLIPMAIANSISHS
jgi:hypothetical protein